MSDKFYYKKIGKKFSQSEWDKVSERVSENLSAYIKLTSVSSNDVQRLITVQIFKQAKMAKICFDWH